MPRLEIRSRDCTPAASRISASSRIVSASTAGSSEPIASAPICQNWRKRPFCGRSRRKKLERYQSFTGCGSLCMPCSMYARHTGAVPSGRSVMLELVVVERVHLLLHDVGRLADAAREQLGRLERRRLDPPDSRRARGSRARGPRARRARAPARPARRTCRAVPGSGRLTRAGPGTDSWRARGRSSCCPCGPGRRSSPPGSASTSRPRLRISVAVSPPGRSVRPTEPANSTSPEKTACSDGIE